MAGPFITAGFPHPRDEQGNPLAPQVFSGKLLASYTLEVGHPWDVSGMWVPAVKRHPGRAVQQKVVV